MKPLWIALAALLGGGVLWGVGRFFWQLRPQADMDGLPTTPLEKLGWIGLGITSAIGAGLALLVAFEGATGVFDDGSALILWLLILTGSAAWFIAWRIIKQRAGSAVVDERDRAILARSLSVESVVVVLSLVAWMIGLTEAYQDEGAVPLAYIQLIFWSTLIGGFIGRNLGIVLGYRREVSIDA